MPETALRQACFGVALALAATGRAAGQAAPCRWVAHPPYVQIAEGSAIPVLADAEFASGAAPGLAPEPHYEWNPDLTRGGRVRIDARGDDSSIVTVSGGGCTPVRVAVLVYSSGTVAQRSLALDYGDSQAHDEFSSGAGEFGTVAAHGEFAEPFGTRQAWLSGDVRSIGYVHRSGEVASTAGGVSLQPTFGVRDTSGEFRGGIALATGGPVAELAYLAATSNTSRPTVGGFGLAVEIAPQLQRTFGAYGALSYYPNLTGGGVRYRAVRFRAALTLSLLPFFGQPYYLEFGALGDRRSDASRAPSSASFQGLAAGLGYRFGSRL
jgi:hypothetical protein